MEQQFQASAERRAAAGTAAIDRGADLLVRVLEAEEPVAVTELAGAAGMPKSTASRLLSARSSGAAWSSRTASAGGCGPGRRSCASPSAGCSSATSSSSRGRRSTALAERSGETINLGVPGGGGVEHVAAGRRPPLPRRRPVGRAHGRLSLHRQRQGVPGFRSRAGARCARALTPYATGTITDPSRLAAELETVAPHRVRDRDRRARARARRDRGAGARRQRRGRRRAQHHRPDRADDPEPDRRAAAGADRRGGLAERAGSDTSQRRRTRRMTQRRDPATALRRDARRQRAGRRGRRQRRASRRASSPRRCCSTR